MIVDAHAHTFRPSSVFPRTADALAPADRDAPVEDLLAVAAAAGVQRVVLVALGTEDHYVAEALRAHPSRVAAVAVAGPAEQGRVCGTDPVAALDRRRAHFPFAALRTQWLGAPGHPLAESPMLPVLRHLAAHRLKLWSYLPPAQLPLLEQIPAVVPDLEVVLNHLGFCPHDMSIDVHGRPRFDDPFPPERLDSVVGLGRHQQMHVMLSGQYALSREPPPYRDLDPVIERLAQAYGADRMLWGSDDPWTRDVPGYATLLSLAASALPDASPTELDAVHGGTALQLFPTLRFT